VESVTVTTWLAGIRGVQSHHRSLLVWPDLVSGVDEAALRLLVHTGARVLALGGPLPATCVDRLQPVELSLWTGRSGAASSSGVNTTTPTTTEWRQMQRLWHDNRLTVLPDSARDDPDWRHARAVHDGEMLACASIQRLAAEVDGARALVCGVAARVDRRRTGHAHRCVAALLPPGEPVAAVLEPGSGSDGFFTRIGWQRTGPVFLYRHS
jgi:hypothetical protein